MPVPGRLQVAHLMRSVTEEAFLSGRCAGPVRPDILFAPTRLFVAAYRLTVCSATDHYIRAATPSSSPRHEISTALDNQQHTPRPAHNLSFSAIFGCDKDERLGKMDQRPLPLRGGHPVSDPVPNNSHLPFTFHSSQLLFLPDPVLPNRRSRQLRSAHFFFAIPTANLLLEQSPPETTQNAFEGANGYQSTAAQLGEHSQFVTSHQVSRRNPPFALPSQAVRVVGRTPFPCA